jgi:hypothetical protein
MNFDGRSDRRSCLRVVESRGVRHAPMHWQESDRADLKDPRGLPRQLGRGHRSSSDAEPAVASRKLQRPDFGCWLNPRTTRGRSIPDLRVIPSSAHPPSIRAIPRMNPCPFLSTHDPVTFSLPAIRAIPERSRHVSLPRNPRNPRDDSVTFPSP